MADPPADRQPDTEEEKPEHFEKDTRVGGIDGFNFEYKFCALVFLRAINKGYKFKLASNVKRLGAFDDDFVEYLNSNSKKEHIFLQLKSKRRQKITMQQLLAGEGNFSLRKYYDSYIKIEKQFNCSKEGVKMDGRIDESLFIIYSNADVEENMKSNRVTDIGEEKFLMTGGSVLQFNEVEHEAIYKHLQDLPKHREFFSRFRIYYSQPNEKVRDWHIKSELQQIMILPEKEVDTRITYMSFIAIMKDWWQYENYFLKDTNSRENDPLRKTSEIVKPILLAKMDQRNSELDELSIKYEEYAITKMKRLTETHKAVLIFAPGSSTTLTAAKIHQMLSDTEHIILNLQQLICYKTGVMLAWKIMFDVLVLECDSSDEVCTDLFSELCGFLNKSVAAKQFIVISKSVGNIQQINYLRRIFNTNLTEKYDVCNFTDIATESQTLFLDKKVYFQGVEVKLSTIVKNDDVGVLNALNCDTISLLLENEKPSIGIRSEDTIKYYIDRTLQRSRQANTRFPAQGEIQHALSGDILQDVRDSGPDLEENLEREKDIVWKPSTLIDGECRIILGTDEPGMGKSTFLTHMANEKRERHPYLWIVRINVNNYTRIFHEMKNNCCDEKRVIKLLTKAAQIKKCDGVVLEGRLFNYTYNSTGNMAVLLDGVDEVSPHYTEEIIQVLKTLSKTKIKRVWVTSRNSMKDRLETEFQCQSYSLVPFSEEDQKRFLVKFWKESCPEKQVDYLENLAKRVVKLSTEQLTVQAKTFMGIPLQSLLLAEMFEGNLKQCTGGGTVELPDCINVVMLYDLYVEKKWAVYLLEKKKSDRNSVYALTDDKVLHKSFMHNHMAAALVAILSTQQLEKLSDKTMVEGIREFLQEITEGLEKTGIIIDVMEGRPVFQHRTLAEYLAATWLCDNFENGQTFMRDHLFESDFHVVRSMVDRILADKYSLHEAVLNSDMRNIERSLERKESITQEDRRGRTPLHVAVSCRIPEVIRLLLEQGADVSSVDKFLRLSPVEYATRMADWQVLSLLMEKRPEIREQVLHELNHGGTEYVASALRAAARYEHTDFLRYLISRGNCVNMALPGDSGTLLHEAARGNHIRTVRTLVDLGASCDFQDANGKTVLHVSAETGCLEVAKFIVEGQEISSWDFEVKDIQTRDRPITKLNRLNVHDKDGNTPLHLAASAGNTSTVLYLLSAGSDIRSCNKHGEYPLILAARYGRNATVELFLQSCYALKCEEIMTSALTAAILAGQVGTTALLLRSGAPVSGGENEKPIHIASRMGHKEIVILLLQNGARLTSRIDSGNRALHLASEAGHLSLVKYLVELDRNGLNTLNYENETALHLAAENGRDDLVTYFAENGCNINAPAAGGDTCLHVACEYGHYTTVECLLRHGAEINAMNSADQTPLHIASCHGHTKIVELLFLHNANFSLQDKDGITALLAASINGHQDTMQFIVQHGGNIKDVDGKGNTIAHFAVKSDNLEMFHFLSNQGANLEVKNSDGDTPLLKAVRERRNRIVHFLVANQSDINTKCKDGMRPLDVAILKSNLKITHLLLEQNARSGKRGMHIVAAASLGFLGSLQRYVVMGCDINVMADNGERPLHAACKSGHISTVQYLCEHGAILDLKDNNGNTALHVAVSNDHLDVTRILVEKCANLCAADASGSTALHRAAKGGYLNIVQYLANSFAPIDMRNAKNETALLVAAADGHEKIVRVLIEQGAGIGVRDIEGKTALDIATDKGYGVIIRQLKDRAEGRILVCSNSHTVPLTESAGGNFEHLQTAVTAEVSMDNATQNNNADTAPLINIRAEVPPEISNHRSALYTAAENGNFEEVEQLVKAGIALDYGDNLGRTALWGAASRGHKNISRLLLANGSCTNIPDCQGMMPIEIAAREGHWEVVDEFLEHGPTIRPEGTEYLRSQLYKASESGEPKVVGIILKCGISVNLTNKYGHTPLHVAAKYGQTEISRILLRNDANVNKADNRGKVPLIVAAENGHVEIIRNLLSDVRRSPNYDRYVDIVDEDGSTPLYVATLNGHVEIVRELLKQGASVDSANSNGWTPLKTAASNGHLKIVRELIQHGAKLEIANNNGWTPLNKAAEEDHVEVVRELLKHGAKLESANNDGWTPLYTASNAGHVEVVRELLIHGANVFIADTNGCTPLNAAASKGHLDVIRELLKHDAGLEIADKDGRSPLYNAALNAHLEVVRELSKHGAKLDRADNSGWTPLGAAASNGHLKIVRELIQHGAKLEIANNNGWTPLNKAAEEDHVEVVRELLKHGAKLESANNDGWTPLYTASNAGHLEVVRELLKHGAKLECANNNGWTPLNAAVENVQVEVVRELLKHGAKLESANKDGWTPLHPETSNGHVEIVPELLKHGAKLESANKDGWKPLYPETSNGHVEVVPELLKHGAKVESANNNGGRALKSAAYKDHVEVDQELLKHGAKLESAHKDGWTPFYTAASKGKVEDVRQLLKDGANVESANSNGWTLLNYAAYKGYVEVVRELLKHGANVENANNDGWTPLNEAAYKGHVEVVRELLKHGAKLESANKNVWTPLNTAAEKGHVEVVRELLKHDAKLEIANKSGWTPLYTATTYGHVEVVRELLKHGANVENANNDGWKPLNEAAYKGHVEVVRELLKHGAKLESANKNGLTPLNTAAGKGHVEVVRELLKHDAKLEIANKIGWTPLYTATSYGHVEVVRELLKHGAKVDTANNTGWTPLNKAAEIGHIKLVRELLKHGAKVESANNKGWTPLKSAAHKGHEDVVRELEKHGAKWESARRMAGHFSI